MNRFAYAHFCEDIRYEVGDKSSLMGLFGATAFVEELPALFPKLCIIAFCVSPITEPIQSLLMQVTFGDEVIYEYAPSAEILKESATAHKRLRLTEDPPTLRSIGLSAVLSPFIVEKEGWLKVRFVADGKEIRAGRLLIELESNRVSAES